MKRTILVLLVLLLLAVCLPAMAAETRALLLGNSYPDVPETLDAGNRFLENVRMVERSLELLDYDITIRSNLTSEELYREIDEVFGEAKEDDISLFFFSGHGSAEEELIYEKPWYEKNIIEEIAKAFDDKEEKTEGLYIGIPDTAVIAMMGEKKGTLEAATYPDLLAALDKIKGKKVVILANCYSGAIFRYMTPQDPDYFVLTASSAYEESWAPDGDVYSYFPKVLSEGIAEIASSDESLTFQKLVQYVKVNIEQYAREVDYPGIREYRSTINAYPSENDLVLDISTGHSERATSDYSEAVDPTPYAILEAASLAEEINVANHTETLVIDAQMLNSLDGIEKFSSVKRIELNNTSISLPLSPISQMAAIETLVVTYREPGISQYGIESLTNLRVLAFIGKGYLSDMSPVSGLTQLEYLTFSNYSFDDVSVLGSLVNLRTLGISQWGSDLQHSVTDLSIIRNMPHLHTMDLGYNSKLTDFSPVMEKDISTLKYLSVRGTGISNSDLKQIRSKLNSSCEFYQ